MTTALAIFGAAIVLCVLGGTAYCVCVLAPIVVSHEARIKALEARRSA